MKKQPKRRMDQPQLWEARDDNGGDVDRYRVLYPNGTSQFIWDFSLNAGPIKSLSRWRKPCWHELVSDDPLESKQKPWSMRRMIREMHKYDKSRRAKRALFLGNI